MTEHIARGVNGTDNIRTYSSSDSFKGVNIRSYPRVRIFSIRIRIRILNLAFYDVDIHLYLIRQFDAIRAQFESEKENNYLYSYL